MDSRFVKRLAAYMALGALALGGAFLAGRASRRPETITRVETRTVQVAASQNVATVATLNHTDSVAVYTRRRTVREPDGSLVTEVERIKQRADVANKQSVQSTTSTVAASDVSTAADIHVPSPSASLPKWRVSAGLVPTFRTPLSAASTYSLGVSRRLVGPLWLDASVIGSPSHVRSSSVVVGLSLTW